MSWLKQPEVPWLLTVVVAVVTFVEYFFVIDPVTTASLILQKWVVVIAFFALVLGTVNLVWLQARHIVRRTKGQWYFSAWLLFLVAFMLIFGLAGPRIASHPLFSWVYTEVEVPIDNALYALLAFYIAGAAYRAFRARNLDATLMIVSGVIVMLFSAPFGGLIWSGIPELGLWILNVPNLAVQRAIIITTVIGMVALGTRILIGREKGVSFRGEQ